MKVVSGFFKVIAFVLMLAVVLSLPWALVARSASQIMFSPETVLSALEEHVFDSETLATIAEHVVRVEPPVEGPQSQVDLLIREAMANLEHDDWVTLFDLIAPPEQVSDTFAELLNGYYEWMDNANPEPEFVVDLRPWKSNTITNAVPVMEMILNALPQCTPEQVTAFSAIVDVETTESMPMCRPSEPFYSLLLEVGASAIPAQVANLPDEFDVGAQIIQDAGGDLALAKQQMLGSRVGMRVGWIALLVVYLIAIPMGARSVKQLFKWAGWPMLLSGFGLLLISLLFLFFTQGILAGVTSMMMIDVPGSVMAPFEGLAAGVLGFMARPLLIQTVVMILFGGFALVVAVLLPEDVGKAKQAVHPQAGMQAAVQTPPPQQLQQEVFQAQTPPPQPMPEPAPEPPKEERKKKAKDDDTPSGMFG